MRGDSRLCVALHVLLHMSELEGPVTSEKIGPLTKTNPVVFRRTMAGLRDAYIVRSVKGHGGGWSLARSLEDVTLADVYDALGLTRSRPFRFGFRDPRARCLLEKAANHAVDEALAAAESLLVTELRKVTVAAIADHARRNGTILPLG
jgi:DNA-binding IscR family transcriptional regulator